MYLDLSKLTYSAFHDLCDDLVKACYPEAICFSGEGGDKGIDCYVGDITGLDLHIFQHKFLPNTLGNSGKGQITRSLETALSNFSTIKKWTLLIPKKFTFEENIWFNSIKIKYNIDIELWDSTKLKSLLFKYPSIRKEYLPLSNEDEKDLNTHLFSLKEKVIDPLIEILKKEPENIPNLNSVLTQKEKYYAVDRNSTNIPSDIQVDYTIIQTPHIDTSLCKDFLNNHYPEVKVEWSNIHSAYDKYQLMIEKINQIIMNKLKHYFNKKEIKFRNENENENQWTDSIPINKFQKKLWNLIRLDEYNDNKFTYDDGYPDRIRILFSSMDRVIYECKPNEDYKQLINNLRDICNLINEELLSEIENYNILQTHYEDKVNHLIEHLIQIYHTPNLKIMDNSDGSIKCNFIN